MSDILSLGHSATTILYTPLTYAYDNASTGWLLAPGGHTTVFPNASFHIEWNGRGIQVGGVAGEALVSLDGGEFSRVPLDGNTLVDYPSLGYGSHSLTVMNPIGGNMTVSSFSLLNVQKYQEGRTNTGRLIPATIQNTTGHWVKNPEFFWDGDWVVDPNNRAVATKPNVLASLSFNVSDSSSVEVYGIGSRSDSLQIDWESQPRLLRRSLSTDTTAPISSKVVQRATPGETLMWKKDLDRSASYLIELDVIADGDQWSVSKVVVLDSIPSTWKKIVLGVTIPIFCLFLLFVLCRCHIRRRWQQKPNPIGGTISAPMLNSSSATSRYMLVPRSKSEKELDSRKVEIPMNDLSSAPPSYDEYGKEEH